MDAYDTTLQQNAELGHAKDLLMFDCMRKYGLPWEIRKRVVPKVNADSMFLGMLDPAQVRRYGYGTSKQRGRAKLAAGTRTSTLQTIGITTTQLRVVQGKVKSFHGKPVPKGGCDTSVNRKLGMDKVIAQWGLLTKIWGHAIDSADADSRVHAIEKKWSVCMAAAGYHYKKPEDARGDDRWPAEAHNLAKLRKKYHSLEIATAKRDLRCRRKVNYMGHLMAVDAAYQKRLIKKDGRRLADGKRAIEAAVRNAAKVVSGR